MALPYPHFVIINKIRYSNSFTNIKTLLTNCTQNDLSFNILLYKAFVIHYIIATYELRVIIILSFKIFHFMKVDTRKLKKTTKFLFFIIKYFKIKTKNKNEHYMYGH